MVVVQSTESPSCVTSTQGIPKGNCLNAMKEASVAAVITNVSLARLMVWEVWNEKETTRTQRLDVL